jgi:parvulin-like peptidyl-prolyl isomerase
MTLVPPTPTILPETITPTLEITGTEGITGTGALTATVEAEPTATLAATETPQATATPSGPITPTATLAPTATPTPYTEEGYQELRSQSIDDLRTAYDISEADIRYVIESSLYREKIMDAVLEEMGLTSMQEQVWLRRIVLPSEEAAQKLITDLEAGADFRAMALIQSTDEFTKQNGGDMGWVSRGSTLPEEVETVAFELEIGEISDPIQTETDWQVIQVLGHEERSLNTTEFEQLREERFQEWLDQTRENAEVEISNDWVDVAPEEPSMPPEILELIQQGMQQQQFPPLPEEDLELNPEIPIEPTAAP